MSKQWEKVGDEIRETKTVVHDATSLQKERQKLVRVIDELNDKIATHQARLATAQADLTAKQAELADLELFATQNAIDLSVPAG